MGAGPSLQSGPENHFVCTTVKNVKNPGKLKLLVMKTLFIFSYSKHER